MKRIIIAGGGFGGIACAKTLLKRNIDTEAEICLIDRNAYHLFTPSLYEVAAAESPRKNISIPFAAIFGGSVRVITGEITRIDLVAQKLQLGDGTSWPYDYLVAALGSETAYFGIPGLKENSLPLKTITDAVRIRKKLDEVCRTRTDSDTIHIIVGGGGFSGVELAAELTSFRDRLTKKYRLQPDAIEMTIVEGLDHILNGLDEKVSDDARHRLENMGVALQLGSNIRTVTDQIVETADGQKFTYDVLIWTGGVSSNGLLAAVGLQTNKKGQAEVDAFLKVKGTDNMFAAGDDAGFMDQSSGSFAPWVAAIAQNQGEVAAENIIRSLRGLSLQPYVLSHAGYIVPLKGRYALAPLKWIYLKGFFAWLLQQLVLFRYLLAILPPIKALRKWNKFESELQKE